MPIPLGAGQEPRLCPGRLLLSSRFPTETGTAEAGGPRELSNLTVVWGTPDLQVGVSSAGLLGTTPSTFEVWPTLRAPSAHSPRCVKSGLWLATCTLVRLGVSVRNVTYSGRERGLRPPPAPQARGRVSVPSKGSTAPAPPDAASGSRASTGQPGRGGPPGGRGLPRRGAGGGSCRREVGSSPPLTL